MSNQIDKPIRSYEAATFRYDKENDVFIAYLKSGWGPVVTGHNLDEAYRRLKNLMPMACAMQSLATGDFRTIIGVDNANPNSPVYILHHKLEYPDDRLRSGTIR